MAFPARPPGNARDVLGKGTRGVSVLGLRRRDWLLLVLAAALAAFTILRGTEPHDEGLMLAAGERIAHGEWPYRDFWSNYLPGQALVLAALSKIFGPSLLAWRVLRVAVGAVGALLAHRLVRRDAGEGWALAAWVAAAAAFAWPLGPGPTAPALTLALGALLARRPGVGGALAGAAFCFRPEAGIAAALGVALRAGGPREAARAAGVAATVGVVALAPFVVVAPADLFDHVFGFIGIQHLQRTPFPLSAPSWDPNKVLESFFPLVLVVALAAWGAWAAARRPAREALAAAPLALAGLGYLLSRPDEFHLLALSVPLAVLLALAAAREPRPVVRAVLVLGLALIALHGLERRAGDALHPPALARVPGGAGDGVRTDPAEAASLRVVVPLVRRLAAPGERIFVANPRHDRVPFGDPLFYVIAGRLNATRYDVMQPGVVTKASVQREMVRDLQRHQVRVVVRWVDPRAFAVEDDAGGRLHGSRVLDRYLAGAFRPLVRTPHYVVMVRRAGGGS